MKCDKILKVHYSMQWSAICSKDAFELDLLQTYRCIEEFGDVKLTYWICTYRQGNMYTINLLGYNAKYHTQQYYGSVIFKTA